MSRAIQPHRVDTVVLPARRAVPAMPWCRRRVLKWDRAQRRVGQQCGLLVLCSRHDRCTSQTGNACSLPSSRVDSSAARQVRFHGLAGDALAVRDGAALHWLEPAGRIGQGGRRLAFAYRSDGFALSLEFGLFDPQLVEQVARAASRITAAAMDRALAPDDCAPRPHPRSRPGAGGGDRARRTRDRRGAPRRAPLLYSRPADLAPARHCDRRHRSHALWSRDEKPGSALRLEDGETSVGRVCLGAIPRRESRQDAPGKDALDTDTLLDEVTDYCRRTGMAESTFGRHSVNDGKFVSRLRLGGRITLQTMDRVHAFMRLPAPPRVRAANGTAHIAAPPPDPERNFRFYDNRQKYLMFVNTCSEKREIANRVALELANIHPRPAGGADVRRRRRRRHRARPACCAACIAASSTCRSTSSARRSASKTCASRWKKMPDRFHEHPATVLILTNLYYSEAPYSAAVVGHRGDQPRMARAAPARQHGGRVRGADQRSRALPGAELARDRQQEERQSGL